VTWPGGIAAAESGSITLAPNNRADATRRCGASVEEMDIPPQRAFGAPERRCGEEVFIDHAVIACLEAL
jgi:hypothetical protein